MKSPLSIKTMVTTSVVRRFGALLAAVMLISTLAAAVAKADFVSPLATDRESMQARFDVLRDPELKELSFTTYTLKNDQIGSMLMSMLIDAAKRGVRVRGIVDNDIAKKTPELITLLNEAGVEIRYYHPIKVTLKKLLNPVKMIKEFDRRFHDKLFIAHFTDGREALLQGDKNYDDIYFAKTNLFVGPKKNFDGREIFIEGDTAHDAQTYFNLVWNSGHAVARKSKPSKSPVALQAERERMAGYQAWVEAHVNGVNWREFRTEVSEIDFFHDDFDSQGRRVYSTLDKVLDLIEKSPPKSDIEIENSYLVLNPKMERAFRAAIAKGSRIRITTNSPESNDVRLVSAALIIDLKKYREIGVELYFTEVANAVHSKLVSINDTLIIMSANFDPRSLKINSESGVIIRDKKLSSHYRELFTENAERSVMVLDDGTTVTDVKPKKKFSLLRPDQPVGALLQRLFISLIRKEL